MCCGDRLNRQSLADIRSQPSDDCFAPISRHQQLGYRGPLCATSRPGAKKASNWQWLDHYRSQLEQKKIMAERPAADGTVMTHAATMPMKWDRRTSFRRLISSGSNGRALPLEYLLWVMMYSRLRRLRAVYCSRKKPTPKTAPTTMCVVDTGRPSCDATRTVRAADTATQNARIGFSLVI